METFFLCRQSRPPLTHCFLVTGSSKDAKLTTVILDDIYSYLLLSPMMMRTETETIFGFKICIS